MHMQGENLQLCYTELDSNCILLVDCKMMSDIIDLCLLTQGTEVHRWGMFVEGEIVSRG